MKPTHNLKRRPIEALTRGNSSNMNVLYFIVCFVLAYFGNIEFNSKEEAIDFFEELNRKHGKTIIISESKFEALIDFLLEKCICVDSNVCHS